MWWWSWPDMIAAPSERSAARQTSVRRRSTAFHRVHGLRQYIIMSRRTRTPSEFESMKLGLLTSAALAALAPSSPVAAQAAAPNSESAPAVTDAATSGGGVAAETAPPVPG